MTRYQQTRIADSSNATVGVEQHHLLSKKPLSNTSFGELDSLRLGNRGEALDCVKIGQQAFVWYRDFRKRCCKYGIGFHAKQRDQKMAEFIRAGGDRAICTPRSRDSETE